MKVYNIEDKKEFEQENERTEEGFRVNRFLFCFLSIIFQFTPYISFWFWLPYYRNTRPSYDSLNLFENYLFYLTIALYCLSCSFCFLSPTYSYLINHIRISSMKEIMKLFFSEAPIITLTAKSYHYRMKYSVQTNKEKIKLPIYSWTDISGLFYLRENICCSGILQLELATEIVFGDLLSYQDYLERKWDLYERNKEKDERISYKEKRGLKIFNRQILFSDGCTGKIFCVFFFKVFTFLTFGGIYMLLFEMCSKRKKFTIRKIVSTRRNLMEEKYKEFSNFFPILSINGKVYSYNQKDFSEVRKLPVPPSFNNLKYYENKIQDFHIPNLKIHLKEGQPNLNDTTESNLISESEG